MKDKHAEIPVKSAYRQRLSEMLDLTYELEGLLHIGISRSAVPPRLNHLIVSKLNAIVALADEPPAPHEHSAAAPPVQGAEPPEEDKTPDPEFTGFPEASEEPVAETGYYADDSEEEEPQSVDGIRDRRHSHARPPMPEAPREAPAEDSVPATETEADPQTPLQAPAAPAESSVAPAGRPAQKGGGRLFSINDRFLYARELFGGKVADFDRAINEVITLDSPEETEEYFISEWNFDPENPVAVEFLDTIKRIF